MRAILLAAILVAACSPFAAPQTTATTAPAPTMTLLEQVCGAPAYSGCESALQSIQGQLDPGQLLAVCAYAEGTGAVVLIEATSDAESTCSADGLLSPSQVIRVVQVP